MRSMVYGILAVAGAIQFATPVEAAGFACPQLSELNTPPLPAEVDRIVPKGPLLEEPNNLSSAIDLLRVHGLSRDDTVNHLIAFYCPAVAANTSLTDAQKTTRVMDFSQMVTRLVLPQDVIDDVIYNVPLPPGIAQIASARASQDGLTIEKWIAQLVEVATR